MCKAIHIAKKALHVLFIYGKQPIGGSILSCIFVIEAMLVCIANAMSINQLFFLFSTAFSIAKKHISCLMFYLMHPTNPFSI